MPASLKESATIIIAGHRHYGLNTMLNVAAGYHNRIAERAIKNCLTCRTIYENAVRIHGWAGPMVESLKED